MKGNNKKSYVVKLSLGLFVGIVIVIIALIIRELGTWSSKFEFKENEIFSLGDNDGGMGEAISIGEYMIYAASIVQASTKDYGSEVWTKTVQDDKGKNISFEEYMKQEIINQIRTTHILNWKAEEYDQSLSEDELRGISEDAQSYYDTLTQYDIGKVGIDLSLILDIYQQNALAEKVYNAIIADVVLEDGMTEDESKAAKIHYFDRIYIKMRKDSCKAWSYDAYVNDNALKELSFANLYSQTKNSSGEVSSNSK
ncbi:MAG: PPIC-type domain [Herbinix sp.]|jgi:hypothetical protein|nr:PPIC-type domain [Herbinix sp.]